MKKEIWKPIEGYEGLYEVSNFGNVRSLDRTVPFSGTHHQFVTLKGRIIKQSIKENGYMEVHLCKNGKERIFKVHRLVAKAFLPNPYNFPQINHKDENPRNNYVDNLEWCSPSYNINYGGRNERLSEKVGNRICQYKTNGEFVASFSSMRVAAAQTGFSCPSIRSVALKKGNRKSTGGYLWLLQRDIIELPQRVRDFQESYSKQHKPIVFKDFYGNIIGEYKSLSEAHDNTGLAKSTIMRYVHTKKPCPNGVWEHKNVES